MRWLGTVDAIAGGAVGEPGKRTFYLQIDVGNGQLWFLLEKQQLAALAARVLAVVPSEGLTGEHRARPLSEPAMVEFRVGDIAIAERGEALVVVLESIEPGTEGVEFEVDKAMMRSMCEEAGRVVAAGRPLCRFCNLPVDPEGHVCPATNGHRGRSLES